MDGVDGEDGEDWVDGVEGLWPLLTPQLLPPTRSPLQTWGKPNLGALGLSVCGQHASAGALGCVWTLFCGMQGALGVHMDHPLWDAGDFWDVHGPSSVGCRGLWGYTWTILCGMLQVSGPLF